MKRTETPVTSCVCAGLEPFVSKQNIARGARASLQSRAWQRSAVEAENGQAQGIQRIAAEDTDYAYENKNSREIEIENGDAELATRGHQAPSEATHLRGERE